MKKSKFSVLPQRGAAAAPEAPSKSRRGNPGYTQISAYLPLDLYVEMRRRLVEPKTTLSEAIEAACRAWLKGAGK